MKDRVTNLMRPEGFVAGPEGLPHTHFDWVGPAYFSTIGTSLLAGRDFTERDDLGSPRVVAINEEMARVFFAGPGPIGRRLVWDVDGVEKPLEILAVTRDVKPRGPRDEPQLRVYLPYFQMPLIRENWIPAGTRFGLSSDRLRSYSHGRVFRLALERSALDRSIKLDLRVSRSPTQGGRLAHVGRSRGGTNEQHLRAATGNPDLPAYIAKALKANPKARSFFQELAPTYRRHFVGWIHTAKRPETKENRIRESIVLLAARKKLGSK